jgi:hypothetical protein
MPTINDSASGASYSQGSAAGTVLRTPQSISAAGSSQSGGDANPALIDPLGAMADFAIFDPTDVDPAVSCLLSVAAGVPNGRAYTAATAPATYTTALGTLWNGAANAAQRAVWSGSTTTAITGAQIEAVNNANLLPADAADYRARLCYTGQLHDAVISRSQDRALVGSWAGKLVNASSDPVTVSTYAMWPTDLSMVPAVAGQLYHGSVYVALPRTGAQWTAGLHFFDSNRNAIGTWSMTAYATHPGGYTWQQSTADAVAPTNTAYAAVCPHIVAAGVNDGEVAYADVHRVTAGIPSLSIGPSAFTPARQQNITVRANRVNLVANPSFASTTNGYWATGGTSPTFVWDGAVGRALPGAGKLTATWSSGSTVPQIGTRDDVFTYTAGRGLARLTPGKTYTSSLWVLLGAGCPPVVITAQIDSNTYISGSSTLTALANPANVNNGFIRLSVTYPVPLTSSGNVSVIAQIPSSEWVSGVGTVSFWVDDELTEEGTVLGDYFDASLPSPDYLWEGAAYASPSHYYRDYRALNYRLNGLVSQAVPAGVPYQLLYAQPTT